MSFLRHVGYGMLGDSCFALYSGPYEPAKIFDRKTAEALAGILFFGDNFAGWMVGFDTRSHWRIVGMGSHDRQPRPQSASTVGEFIAQEIVGLTTDRTGGENRP